MGNLVSPEQPDTDAQAIVDAARQAGTPRDLDPTKPQAILVPANDRIEIPDLTAWQLQPVRKTGVYKTTTVAAFTAYTKAHAAGDATTTWISTRQPGHVVAVLDDNAPGEPGWGQHRVELTLQHTPEWRYWLGQDNKWMSQEDFAEHVEGGLMDIIDPAAADLLELAQSFQATKDATFSSAKRLDNGETQFTYSEEIAAKAGATGQLEIPKAIVLHIAPFTDEDALDIHARFRYRLNGGDLKLGYVIERPHLVIETALENVQKKIEETLDNVYVGEPAPLR